MAFALVGAAGAATQGAANSAVTPAWNAGAARTVGNLLLLFVSCTGVNGGTPTITGWTAVTATGTSCSANIYWRIATGADAAPTVPAIVSGVVAAHLEEWSGGSNAASPVDRSGTAAGTTSPQTATLAAADVATAELMAMSAADFRSVARASNDTWTSNHGTPTLQASNNGISSVNHYSHATLVTNSNAAANTAIVTLSVTTSITGIAVVAVSFLLYTSPVVMLHVYPQILSH